MDTRHTFLHLTDMNPNPIDPLLTSEAARIIGVSPETIRAWEGSGRLPALKTGRGVRLFNRSDVEQLADERRRRARGDSATSLRREETAVADAS